MKKQSTPAYILRLALTLLLITGVVAAALAGINALTAPKIAELNAKKTQDAIEAVLPGGGEEIDFADETGMVRKVYASDAGFAVLVEPNGFGGKISMMVGFSTVGNITGVSIISHTETASLGAVAAADNSAGENFRDQYVGQSGSLAVTQDGGVIDSITGATITSRAVTVGVNAATACIEPLRWKGAAE